ncbi:hypothetical protein F0L68_20560 [Solihabitans fulvus]|uniref:Uncharacterized protein n=1 Tax=Solihabitans fulvus TaxID=1892852 RepID=A0A5B2XAH7_9PSEU|nr:hypothetical protein [Solihabitans fulvus]KAA2260120.1 hypothetical protein F0L68_20560 [Solihabitans fulvus]
MTESKPEADQVETWTDEDSGPLFLGPVVDAREQRRHVAGMQSRVLLGIGAIFLVTLLVIVLGPRYFQMQQDVVHQLIQTVLPSVLAAGATIVGTLFGAAANRREDR